MERPLSRFEKILWTLSGAFLCFLLWEFLGTITLSVFFPPLAAVFRSAFDLLVHDEGFRGSILYSVSNVYIGTGIAFLGSFTIAVMMSLSQRASTALLVPVDILRNIAALSLYPLFILLFGLGKDAHVAIIVWNTWANVLLVAYKSLMSVEKEVIEAASLDGADRFQILRYMRIPLIMPDVLLAIRVSFGLGWFAIIVSEMLGGSQGLGHLVMLYSNAFDFPRMYATIVVTSVSGLIMSVFWAKVSGFILDRIL